MMDGITRPVSRLVLREIANKFRERFCQNGLYINVLALIEIFPIYFPKCIIVIVADNELGDGIPSTIEKNIYQNDEKYIIKIKESVYERACNGSGGDRMHIIHEMSHYILIEEYDFKPITARSYGDIHVRYKPRSIEWQAKALAGEIMMPYELTKGMTAKEISKKCGVSIDAAKMRTKYY